MEKSRCILFLSLLFQRSSFRLTLICGSFRNGQNSPPPLASRSWRPASRQSNSVLSLEKENSLCPRHLCGKKSSERHPYALQQAFHIRFPKYWSFSFSTSPSSEYSGLIFFKMDWFDVLAVKGTLKSFLQFHSSKALILQHLAFFINQLSHWYMTTTKPIALTTWTFVGKLMSLLFIYLFN